jgi:formate-dependent nitrite reductase cytochrome c552 subunit
VRCGRLQAVERATVVAEPSERPFADHVPAPSEQMCHMSVEALDTLTSPADAAGRSRSDMICGNCCVSFGLVGGMCASDFGWIEIGFRLANAADCFDATDGPHEFGTNEVVASGHWCAVAEKRGVANNNRVTLRSAHDDVESTSRWAPDQLLDASSVVH